MEKCGAIATQIEKSVDAIQLLFMALSFTPSLNCQNIAGKGLFTTKSTSCCFVLQHHTYTIKGKRTKSKILCMQFKGILQVTIAYFNLDRYGSIVSPFAIFVISVGSPTHAQKERVSGGIFTWFEMCNFNIEYQQTQHYEP